MVRQSNSKCVHTGRRRGQLRPRYSAGIWQDGGGKKNRSLRISKILTKLEIQHFGEEKKNLHGVGGMKEKSGRKTLYMAFAIIQVRGDEVLN